MKNDTIKAHQGGFAVRPLPHGAAQDGRTPPEGKIIAPEAVSSIPYGKTPYGEALETTPGTFTVIRPGSAWDFCPVQDFSGITFG